MTFGRKLDLFVLAVGVLLLGWCTIYDPTPTYRYRLTVEVETPEGLRTGSSVIEVDTAQSSDFSLFPGSISWRARGEAVAVDLPGGRTLFALLRSENDIDWANRVLFMLAPETPKTDEDLFQSRFNNLLRLKGPIVLPRMWPPVADLPERSAYPMMVTFGDLADPSSVDPVDPEDLAASFGGGTSLKRIIVQMTEAAVTREGVDKRLPWLPSSVGSIVSRPKGVPIGDMPIEHQINKSDFRR